MYDFVAAKTILSYACYTFLCCLLPILPIFIFLFLELQPGIEIKPKFHRQCFLWNITIEPQAPVISHLFKRIRKANQYHIPQRLNGTQKSHKTQTTRTHIHEVEDYLKAKLASYLNELAQVWLILEKVSVKRLRKQAPKRYGKPQISKSSGDSWTEISFLFLPWCFKNILAFQDLLKMPAIRRRKCLFFLTVY